MIPALLGLRLVLGFLAAYHLTIGLLSAFAPAWTRRVTRGLYALELDDAAQVGHAVRMLGLYALTLGYLLTVAAMDPLANRPIIIGIIFLQSMRALFRFAHRTELSDRFGIPRGRNAFNTGLLVFQVALLVAWFPL